MEEAIRIYIKSMLPAGPWYNYRSVTMTGTPGHMQDRLKKV